MTAPLPNTRPTLVLLHGAVVNHRMWDPVVAILEPEFRIVRPDLPGHGALADQPFTLAAAVGLVRKLVHELDAPVVLVGDSLGGYVALAAAGELGPPLKGLVLGGCTATFKGLSYWIPRVVGVLTDLTPPAKLMARMERMIRRDIEWADAIVAAGLRPAAFSRAVAEVHRFDFRRALTELRVPIVFVNGDRDWIHCLSEVGAHRAAPHARMVAFKRTPHGVALRQPAEFARVVRDAVLSPA